MIKVAVVGTGGMAKSHVENFKKIKGCKVVAGVDVNQQRAEEFCKTHGIAQAYSSVSDLLKSS